MWLLLVTWPPSPERLESTEKLVGKVAEVDVTENN